jgi:microcin C transport system permease protein
LAVIADGKIDIGSSLFIFYLPQIYSAPAPPAIQTIAVLQHKQIAVYNHPMINLSPLTRRRLSQFRANARGFWSLWIFLVLFIGAIAAPLIANDRPVLVKFDGKLLMPVFKDYPETVFGGDFETNADYRDPYVVQLINDKGWAVWPPIRFNYDTINYNLPTPAPSAPTGENLLGTDDQGRDVAARVIYGFRISVLFGLALTFLSSVIGITAGAFQGYYGGWLDLIMQRLIEIWSSMPSLYILIIFSAMFVPGFWTLLLILLLFSWVGLVDVVRAEFFRTRNFDYVRAANALGVPSLTIMRRHVLPNAMVATMTLMPFILTGSITALTSLDFLGLGLPPGSPSLGELLAQGKNNLQAPWLGFTAFITLATMLTLLTFIGEAVRDAFDPRKTNL